MRKMTREDGKNNKKRRGKNEEMRKLREKRKG